MRNWGLGDVCNSLTVPDDVILPPLVDQIVVLNWEQGVGRTISSPSPCCPTPFWCGITRSWLAQLPGKQATSGRLSRSRPYPSWEENNEGEQCFQLSILWERVWEQG